MNVSIKSVTESASRWHVAGHTNSRRGLMVASTDGHTIAIIPIPLTLPDGEKIASEQAALVASAGNLVNICEKIQRRAARFPNEPLPKFITNQLIATMQKVGGRI